MSDPEPVRPAVPGLQLDRLLGRGAHGEVWSALDQLTGARVAAKIGLVAPGAWSAAAGWADGQATTPTAMALEREVRALSALRDPGVVRLRRVTGSGDGRPVLVLDLHPGSLAALVAGTGALPPGRVSELLASLAACVARLHAAGLAHGDLTPANVLVDDGGRPVLADFGACAPLRAPAPGLATPGYGEAAAPGPAGTDPARRAAADVFSLGAVASYALLGRPDGLGLPGTELGRLVAACLSADPAGRPSAAAVARRATGPGEPAAVRVAVPLPVVAVPPTRQVREPVDTTPRRLRRAEQGGGRRGRGRPPARRHRRVMAVAAVGTGAGAAAAAVLLLGVGGGGVGVGGGRPGQASQPALQDVVARLAEARASALAAADPAGLAAADAPGSPALAADAALVRRLQRDGIRLAGLRFTVRVAATRPAGPQATRVEVVQATSAHHQVRLDGTVARQVPAAPPRHVVLVLRRGGDGWRVQTVEGA